MGTLSRDDVLKLAQLARLELTEDEITIYGSELTKILEYVGLLEDIDVTGLKPTQQVTGLVNVTRPDEIKDYGYKPADLYKNVPDMENDQIKVKRMIQ